MTILTMNEAARALGIAASTLRTLTDRGHIACERNARNHRVYRVEVITAEKLRRQAKSARIQARADARQKARLA